MTILTRIDRWEDIPAAISKMQLVGAGHRVPVLQALYHGHIAHLELHRPGSAGSVSAGLFKRWAALIRLPAIALIGDDDETAPAGPDAWPIAPRVLRWAKFVMIHGARGELEHYELAVALAIQFRRLALIECASVSLEDWQDAVQRWAPNAEKLVLRPEPGFSHPAPRKSGELH